MVYFLIGTQIKGNENSTISEIKNQVSSNASIIKQINVYFFNEIRSKIILFHRLTKKNSRVKD